jgi:hypothetical protein
VGALHRSRGRPHRGRRPLLLAAKDAELIALRILEDDPPCAAAVVVALVIDVPRAERDDPPHLLVAGAGEPP